MGVTHVLALDPAPIAQHDIGDRGGGWRRTDWPFIAGLDQARQPSDVVIMRSARQSPRPAPGIERHLAIGTGGIDPFRIEQPAVEQYPIGTDLQ